jgi:hypothetical protein
MSLETRISKLEKAAADRTEQPDGFVTSYGNFQTWSEAAADRRFPAFAEDCRAASTDDEKCKSLSF